MDSSRSKNSKQPRTVKCPSCGKETVFVPENRDRPFCSERCKIRDLGAWASEDYRIPVAERPAFQAQDEENDLNYEKN